MHQRPSTIFLSDLGTFFIGQKKTDDSRPLNEPDVRQDAAAAATIESTEIYKLVEIDDGEVPIHDAKPFTTANLARLVLEQCATFVPRRPIPVRTIHSWFGLDGQPQFRIDFYDDDNDDDNGGRIEQGTNESDLCIGGDATASAPALNTTDQINRSRDRRSDVLVPPDANKARVCLQPALPRKMSDECDECFAECLDYALGDSRTGAPLPSRGQIRKLGCQGDCSKPAHPKFIVAFAGRILLDDEGRVWCVDWCRSFTRDRREVLRQRGTFGYCAMACVPAAVQIPHNEPIVSVAVGKNHVLLLGARGQVYAFGSNTRGQLGIGTRGVGITDTPVLNEHLPPIRSIFSTHGKSSVVLDAQGSLWTFGDNWYGQLGAVRKLDEAAFYACEAYPIRVDLPIQPWMVACGHRHVVLTDKSGDIWCFGMPLGGALGLGDSYATEQLPILPTRMKDVLHDWPTAPIVHLGVSQSLTLVQDHSGALWSWGSSGTTLESGWGNTTRPTRLGHDFVCNQVAPAQSPTKNARSALFPITTTTDTPLVIVATTIATTTDTTISDLDNDHEFGDYDNTIPMAAAAVVVEDPDGLQGQMQQTISRTPTEATLVAARAHKRPRDNETTSRPGKRQRTNKESSN